jgi:hypothetical protein
MPKSDVSSTKVSLTATNMKNWNNGSLVLTMLYDTMLQAVLILASLSSFTVQGVGWHLCLIQKNICQTWQV